VTEGQNIWIRFIAIRMKRTMYVRGFGLFLIAMICGSNSYLVGNTNNEVFSRLSNTNIQLLMEVHRLENSIQQMRELWYQYCQFVFIIVFILLSSCIILNRIFVSCSKIGTKDRCAILC